MGKHRSVKSLKQSLHSPSPHRTSHASRTFPINPIMGDDKKDLESECNDSPSGMNPIIVYSIIAVVCLVGGFVLGMMLCGGGGGTEILVQREGNKNVAGTKIDSKTKLMGGDIQVDKKDFDKDVAQHLADYVYDQMDDKKKSKTFNFTVKYQGEYDAAKAAKSKGKKVKGKNASDEEASDEVAKERV